MFVRLERVAIITIQAKLGREPQKSEIVLHPSRRCCLRDSLTRREGPEPDTLPLGKCHRNLTIHHDDLRDVRGRRVGNLTGCEGCSADY